MLRGVWGNLIRPGNLVRSAKTHRVEKRLAKVPRTNDAVRSRARMGPVMLVVGVVLMLALVFVGGMFAARWEPRDAERVQMVLPSVTNAVVVSASAAAVEADAGVEEKRLDGGGSVREKAPKDLKTDVKPRARGSAENGGLVVRPL